MTRPDPPAGARNFVLLILDSCRYDSFVAASPKTMARIGTIERRFSYASWTSPSHFNLLMGLLPHTNPQHVFASTYYKQELAGLAHRLGISEMGFVDMVPRLWLPIAFHSFTWLRPAGWMAARINFARDLPCLGSTAV